MLPPFRLKLRFHGEGYLPVTYREGVQAALYQLLPSPLGEKLHDGGLLEGTRPLKLFVFSRLLGLEYLPQTRSFRVRGDVILYFASALPEVLEGAIQGVWRNGGMAVHGLELSLKGLEQEPIPEVEGALEVEALAPIAVYRTLGGTTQYYNPWNREFALLISENLSRKAGALGLEGGRVAVRPLGVKPAHKRLERYQGTWVEGWMGRYRLEGPPTLLRLALLAGLGSKNSQGFGFVREAAP